MKKMGGRDGRKKDRWKGFYRIGTVDFIAFSCVELISITMFQFGTLVHKGFFFFFKSAICS